MFGVKLHKNKWLYKEQESIQNITDAFKGEEMLSQYNVNGYRIDLYFPKYKIAIECDELGHRDRDVSYEIKRQMCIENLLSCQFIRFNPDAEDFSIFKVINEIFKKISS